MKKKRTWEEWVVGWWPDDPVVIDVVVLVAVLGFMVTMEWWR
jgi:hypothetical protein